MLLLCCSIRQSTICEWHHKTERGVEGSQLDGCRWVQRRRRSGWSLICVRVGDTLSLLIIVWILFILSSTFSWQQTVQTRDLTLQPEAWEEKIEDSTLVLWRTYGKRWWAIHGASANEGSLTLWPARIKKVKKNTKHMMVSVSGSATVSSLFHWSKCK